MRELRRLVWVAAITVATAPAAFGQTTGGTTGGATGGTLGGATGGTTGGGGTGTGGGAGGGSGIGNTGANNIQLLQFPTAPQLIPPSQYALSGSVNAAIQSSNFLGPTYGNPYFQGMRTNALNGNAVPGGFGAALYGTTGGGAGGRGGAAGGGAAGGIGGGRGGAGGTAANSQDPGGVLVALPKAISYTAVSQFQRPVSVPVLQTDLRGVLDRTSMIANPAGVQLVLEGNNVILRGSVRDGEEARTAEGLVRLTPGVGRIRNELSYPGK